MKTFFDKNKFGKFFFFEILEGDKVFKSDKFLIPKGTNKKDLSFIIYDKMIIFNNKLK